MSFAGVSLIRDGKLWPSASANNDAGSASGYHLLVVEGYSRTKADVLNGKYIESRSFRVGGYLWLLRYYPNGCSGYPDFISASLVLAQDVAMPVKAECRFGFIDQADEPSYIRACKASDFSVKDHDRCRNRFIRRDVFENSEHLQDDSFTIRCEIMVIEDVYAKATGATSPFVTVPPPDMQRHYTELLTAKEGTDVTFKVCGETFTAHRCILAVRSRVFKAELFGPMKEGTATGAIHVEDMEAQVFRTMLAFIYTDSEPELEKGDDEDVIWQQLLVAADRYDLQRLKLMCENKLCGYIDVNTTAAILALADCHGCDGLKKACFDFLGTPGNVKAVVATDGFDHLIRSCPSVVKELIAMLAP